MRRGTGRLALFAFGLVACNGILGIEEPEHKKADSGVTGGSAGTGAVGGGGTGATGGSGGTGGSVTGGTGGVAATDGAAGSGGSTQDAGDADAPNCTQYAPTLSADSVIFSSGCNGSISYGDSPYGNIGVGRAILRFDLGAPEATALNSGTAKSMTLTLNRNIDCEGDTNACGGLDVTGTFQVFPLRNDWTEKSAASTYSGADWCRRTDGSPGSPWQTPGADGSADHGGPGGSLNIDAATNTAVFSLDPAQWKNWVPSNQVSVLVVLSSSTGRFVYATRESTKYQHSTLTVSVCQ